ncbi:hypothetical protein DFH06DRAFT_690839 [Mycena polygramma]|nr:hypothetical protein DFH06DRAFT_690839 [Mycena polygramma]
MMASPFSYRGTPVTDLCHRRCTVRTGSRAPAFGMVYVQASDGTGRMEEVVKMKGLKTGVRQRDHHLHGDDSETPAPSQLFTDLYPLHLRCPCVWCWVQSTLPRCPASPKVEATSSTRSLSISRSISSPLRPLVLVAPNARASSRPPPPPPGPPHLSASPPSSIAPPRSASAPGLCALARQVIIRQRERGRQTSGRRQFTRILFAPSTCLAG